MSIRITALYSYPLKSCAALGHAAIQVEPRGLAGDRRWLIVDAQHRFVSGREIPRLVLIKAEPQPQGLLLRAPGQPPLVVPSPGPEAERLAVQVWHSTVQALASGRQADTWVSQFLQSHSRLVFMDALAMRKVDPRYGRPGDEVSFADAYPLLLLSQASLDGLNQRLHRSVPMLRFRPNLVIDGVPAHAEDGWRRIRAGGIELEIVKPCTRCGFTTVMPETGRLDPSGEPLRTLAGYRRAEGGVVFGQNVIARGRGRLSLGDTVEVLE